MYDELEVNKSRFKTVILTKAFFKNIKAISNTKFITCGFNNCIFESVHFI